MLFLSISFFSVQQLLALCPCCVVNTTESSLTKNRQANILPPLSQPGNHTLPSNLFWCHTCAPKRHAHASFAGLYSVSPPALSRVRQLPERGCIITSAFHSREGGKHCFFNVSTSFSLKLCDHLAYSARRFVSNVLSTGFVHDDCHGKKVQRIAVVYFVPTMQREGKREDYSAF